MFNFNTFDEIEHKPLRNFNRAQFFSNLYEDQGAAVAQRYAEMFPDDVRKEISLVIVAVRKNGVKKVREAVTEGVLFPENMTEEEAMQQALKVV